jgi:hypothetical protein
VLRHCPNTLGVMVESTSVPGWVHKIDALSRDVSGKLLGRALRDQPT